MGFDRRMLATERADRGGGVMQRAETRAAIVAMGDTLGPDVLQRCTALFAPEQEALARSTPASLVDAVYGDHPRQRLDLYRPADGSGDGVPIVLFVHGGGFRLGDKGSAVSWANANVGRMAARAGLLGAVMNYRLAPAFGWPSGGEDVGAAVDWLRTNAAAHGGDGRRIVLVGTSAGAVHVATHLQLRPESAGVRAAALLSGLYGVSPLDERDNIYFGPSARMPLEALATATTPLLVAGAEFDPPRFQAELLGLLRLRLERQGSLPRTYVASGHNHYSISLHLGGADTRLADEIIAFVHQQCEP